MRFINFKFIQTLLLLAFGLISASLIVPQRAEALMNNNYLPYRELTIGPAQPTTILFSGLNDGSIDIDAAWYLGGDWQFSDQDNLNGGQATNVFVQDVLLTPTKGYGHDQGNDQISFSGFSANVLSNTNPLKYLLTKYPSLCSLAKIGANSTTVVGSRIVCTLSLTSKSTQKVVYLPIVIKDPTALYAFSVSQVIQNQANVVGPGNLSPGNPFVVSSGASGQVSLGNFFHTPTSGQVVYSLDSTNVCDPNDPMLSSYSGSVSSSLNGRPSRRGNQNPGVFASSCGLANGVVELPNSPGGKVAFKNDWTVNGDILSVGPTAKQGIYQVNIKASISGQDVLQNQSTQVAFQTIYVNVGGADQNYFFSGQLPFSFLYAYNGGYKTKPLPALPADGSCPATEPTYQYTQTVVNQSKDVNQINSIFSSGSGGYNLRVLATAVGQLEYQNSPSQGSTVGEDCLGLTTKTQTATRCNFWATQQLNTPFDGYGQSYSPLSSNLGAAARITSHAGLGNVDMGGDDQTGVCTYSSTIGNSSSTKLVLDFEQPKGAGTMSGKAMSGELGSQNDTQSFILAAAYVKQLFNRPGYVGVSLDFEAGFSGDPYYTFIKNLADRLAFRGQLLADYDFPQRAFTDGVVVALGPTGVAIFSAYDIAADRAPIAQGDNVTLPWNGKQVYYNFSDIQNGGIPLLKQGLTNSQESFYAMMFAPNPSLPKPLASINCTDGLDVTGFTYLSGGTIDKKACLDSLYESWSENIHFWAGQPNPTSMSGNNAKMTPYQLFTYFKGRYIPVVPVAQSVTQSPYFVIPKPTITFSSNGSAVPAVVSSASSSTTSPTDAPGISKALGSSSGNISNVVSSASSVPFQTFFNCPGSTNFASCIIVSAPVAFQNTTTGASGYNFPRVEDYIINDTKVYQYYNTNNISAAAGPGSLPASVPANNVGIIGVGFFGLGDALSEGISAGCNVPTSNSATANKACMEPWYIGFQDGPITVSTNSTTPSVDDFYKYYQSNNNDPANPKNGLNTKLYAPLIDNFNVWRTANNLLASFKSGPAYYPAVAWANHGLPASAFSGNPLTATFTADASVTSGAVKYTCWVLSHAAPARTCSVVPPSSGNQASVVLSQPSSTVVDNDYAVFVRASAGQNTLFADSVYLNISPQ